MTYRPYHKRAWGQAHARCARAAALGFLLSSIALSGCKRGDQSDSRGPVIAELSKLSGKVNHRPSTSLTWARAEQQMKLFARDAVKTGSSAGATIGFVAGGELEVDERSLVIIEAPPQREGAPSQQASAPVARVQQGTVRGVVRPNSAPLQLIGPDGKRAEIAASGSDKVPFRVRLREGGALEVAVLEGSAQIRSSSGERTTVRANQAVDLRGSTMSAPVTLLPYPALQEPDVDATVSPSPELTWEPVPGASAYHVQLSWNIDFQRKLVDAETSSTSYRSSTLERGRTYVWRVSSVDGDGREGEFGFARRFWVEKAPAQPVPVPVPAIPAVKPRLMAPRNDAGFEYLRSAPAVTFRWQGSAKSYELVIAQQRNLRRGVVVRKKLSVSKYQAKNLEPGTYFWGVYGIDEAGKRKPLSKRPRRLVVARRLPPELRLPSALQWE